MSDIVKRLNTLADMIMMGDKISWGSDSKIMREAAEEIEKLRERLEKAHSFISRADWMQFFEEEHAAAAALKETGDE